MNHSTGKPTQSQAQRLERVASMRCIACEIYGTYQPWPTEVHHLVDKGYRKHSGGHDATIPLDSWHHRGVVKDGLTSSDMTMLYGPSLAKNKRAFVGVFGTERDLLARVNERLA